MISFIVASICAGMGEQAKSACEAGVKAAYIQSGSEEISRDALRSMASQYPQTIQAIGAAGYVLKNKGLSLNASLPLVENTIVTLSVTGASLRMRWSL